jgi:hypothetical protein
MVEARGAKVILEIPAELRRLVDGIEGVAEIVAHGTHLPDFHWHSPLLSLPRAFRTELDSIPANVPYLRADSTLVQQFTQNFLTQPGNDGLRIGLVWSGSPRHTRDRQRSMSLAQLRALTDIPRTTFYSLQKGPAAKQLLDLPMEMNLIDLAPHLNDFADTAAALASISPARSVSPCGSCSRTIPTGADCSTVATARGIRVHACSGSPPRTTGPR